MLSRPTFRSCPWLSLLLIFAVVPWPATAVPASEFSQRCQERPVDALALHPITPRVGSQSGALTRRFLREKVQHLFGPQSEREWQARQEVGALMSALILASGSQLFWLDRPWLPAMSRGVFSLVSLAYASAAVGVGLEVVQLLAALEKALLQRSRSIVERAAGSVFVVAGILILLRWTMSETYHQVEFFLAGLDAGWSLRRSAESAQLWVSSGFFAFALVAHFVRVSWVEPASEDRPGPFTGGRLGPWRRHDLPPSGPGPRPLRRAA